MKNQTTPQAPTTAVIERTSVLRSHPTKAKTTCCHTKDATRETNYYNLAVSATIHCLTGCSVGEFLGLAIGVSLGWSVWPIIILDTTLAYITGFAFTLIPLMRYKKMSLKSAFKLIWIGEVVSIFVMEFAMNFTDYHMGGMAVGSIWTTSFWTSFGVALVAGYIAAYPVNYWMLKKNLKNCH